MCYTQRKIQTVVLKEECSDRKCSPLGTDCPVRRNHGKGRWFVLSPFLFHQKQFIRKGTYIMGIKTSKKRNLPFLCLCLCLGLCLCACQQTPEQVKQNMAQYGENRQMGQTDITYCTVGELRDAQMPDVDDAGGVTLPETVDFSGVEGVEVLHLSVEKDFLAEETVKKYASLFGVERDKLTGGGMDLWGGTIRYDNETDQYMNMSQNGGMAQGCGFSYDIPDNEVEKIYKMDEEDTSGTEVRLTDGKINLKQFCKDTESWLEKHMAVGGGIHYRVSDVYVRKRKSEDDPSRVISLCAEYDYKGIRLDNHTMSLSEEDEEFKEKPITTVLFTSMEYEKQGAPCFFSRNSFFHLDSSEPVEKVVDLASAVRIVKEKLSGFGALQITKVIPLYVPYVGEEDELPGAGIEARPVYAFLIEEETEPPLSGIVKSNSCNKFLFVDMVTGELTVELGAGQKETGR